MSSLFEDYREIDNVRNKLDLLLELVETGPRRVFITERGKVQAVVMSASDYEDLWNLELDRDMKLCDLEPGDTLTTEEFIQEVEAHLASRNQGS